MSKYQRFRIKPRRTKAQRNQERQKTAAAMMALVGSPIVDASDVTAYGQSNVAAPLLSQDITAKKATWAMFCRLHQIDE